MLRAPILAFALLLACSSQPSDASKKAEQTKASTTKADPPAKADTKPDAKPDAKSEAKSDTKAETKPDAKADAKTDAAADAKADTPPDGKAVPAASLGPIIDGLLGVTTVAHSPKDGAVVYGIGGSVEGTGALLTLTIRTPDGKTKDLELCDADPDCEATAKAKRSDIEAFLKDREWVALRTIDWPEGAAKVEDGGMTFEWKGGKLTGKRQDGSNVAFPKIPDSKPHVASPSSIHVSDAHPIVVATFTFDPGEAYGEGFNVFTDVFVALPPT